MPKGLHRYYGTGHLHFITTSCYQRQPLLDAPRYRDLFLEILEQVRVRCSFIVVGYVVMPEHIHLLISEPDRGTPFTVLQVLKQRFARRVLGEQRHTKSPQLRNILNIGHFWQRRYYDFVVRSEEKKIEAEVYSSQSGSSRTGTGT
jgi:putative transposase